MSDVNIRGVETSKELKGNIDIRDTRSTSRRFIDSMSGKNFPLIALIFFSMGILVFTNFSEIFFLMGLLFYPIVKKKQENFTLPFKLPKTSGKHDMHEWSPNNTGSKAKGIIFLGNEIRTNNELWITDSDARQHILLFGTTGAGKAFKMDEIFLTSKGWKENKDLKIGDELATPFGTFSKVKGIFPQEPKQMMKLTFENGLTKEVSEDHLWEFYLSEDNYDYLNYEKFREKQDIKVAETKHIKDLLENQKVFIPLSDMIDNYEIELKEFDLEQLSLFLKDNMLNGEDVDFYHLHQKIIDKLHELIDKGSLKQRQRLESVFVNLLLKDVKQINNFIVNEKQSLSKVYVKNSHIVELLQKLYFSLGYLSQVQKDLNNRQYLKFKRSFVIEIKSIEKTTIEECQCIKIEDERGLLVLKDYIVSHNTEALLSIATNAFIHGSGLIMVDGKGTTELFGKFFSLCRSFRREDDLLVINYMTSGNDVFGKQERLISNTLNPFISGSSGGLTEMLVGLMDSGGGSDPMWQGRAIALISAMMMALVWMRDNEGVLLDIDLIREHLLLEKIAELAEKEYGGVSIIRKAINAYLVSIPGYNKNKPIKDQESVVAEQHGYLQMQFTKILSSLSDTYGYIFRTNLGHIDFRDVVLNRRILIVLLPALEKSDVELQNLGKLIVACVKSMMASQLGSQLDTDVKSLKGNDILSPFYCIFDEYGYYIVKGSAVMPAQARSLGFCMIFAGQDLPGFQKNNMREEAASIIGNCNMKIFMKIEDMGDTYNLAKQTAGQVMVEAMKSKDVDYGMINAYWDSRNISYEKRDRVDSLDLKAQANGEAHFFTSDRMVRGKFFFVDPKMPEKLKIRPNYFIKVEPPLKEVLEKEKSTLYSIIEDLKNTDYLNDVNDENQHSMVLKQAFAYTNVCEENKVKNSRIGATLLSYILDNQQDIDSSLELINEQFEDIGNAQVTVFGSEKQRLNNNERFITSNGEQVFIRKEDFLTDIDDIVSATGKDRTMLLGDLADKYASEKLASIQKTTIYPSPDAPIPEDRDPSELAVIVTDLSDYIDHESV